LPSEKLALFSDSQSAVDCKAFITSFELQKDAAVDPISVSLFAVDFDHGYRMHESEAILAPTRLYAVVYPAKAQPLKMTFWRLTGLGISSRRAESCLNRKVQFTPLKSHPQYSRSMAFHEHPIYDTLRNGIARLLERAPLNPARNERVSSNDVYLYPSGMSAIYHAHQSLLRWRSADIILLGFPYELSIKMVEILGVPYRFFSFGTDSEIDALEAFLQKKADATEKIQAVWCECPNNPMMRTVDLNRVRNLADKYDFLLVVDDTIGSFANIDVQDIADVVVTSLTKNYSGFADVLAGRLAPVEWLS
jgi:cystathionine gamma-synthase